MVEPILRGLLLDEGRVVSQRPTWARSHHDADLYLQLGDWMLLIGCLDRLRAGHYAIVTAVNGPADNTWRVARRRGYISTPPPMPLARRRPSVLVSVARAFDDRRPGEGLPAAIRRIHRARWASAQADYDRALLERWRGRARA